MHFSSYHMDMGYLRKTATIISLLAILTACQFSLTPIKSQGVEPTIQSSIIQDKNPSFLEPTSYASPSPTTTKSKPSTITPYPSIVFGVIGDYGSGDERERLVSQLVTSWKPDLIITSGDNNYPLGEYGTIDVNIGQFYQEYIGNYKGTFGNGSDENRFFPSMGNHDWLTDDANPYFDYFELPGNERYYFFSWNYIDFFALNSDGHEPDGFISDSIQGKWLREHLAVSTGVWKIVYFHHAPYTSGYHSSSVWMQWPFQEWGADLVISGHSHVYERLEINGLIYIVNGLGGGVIYDFVDILPESLLRYNQDHGALRITGNQDQLKCQFMNTAGDIIDDFTLSKTH
ncbi:metallophosphoesterase family protein [Chloroflexota bacterium]